MPACAGMAMWRAALHFLRPEPVRDARTGARDLSNLVYSTGHGAVFPTSFFRAGCSLEASPCPT